MDKSAQPSRARSLLVALALAATACAGERAPEPPRHVFLISIDTLRASHCSLYGYAKPTTPFLEELAERGVVFENHMVNANNTLLSHTSLLTGLSPQEHRTYDRGPEPEARQALAPGYVTLAERFEAAGYATGSFTTHPIWLGRDFGLDQGFDAVESDWIEGTECAERFLAWYDAETPERLFAFLHFYDPHSEPSKGPDVPPYASTPEHILEFAGERPEGWVGCARGDERYCGSRYLNMVTYGVEELGPGHLDYIVGLYDAGIAKFDDDLRAIFGELEARGLLEDALVVITSDHGEAFLDHGQMLHGTHHDEVMHVPLLVVPPRSAGIPPGRVADVTRSVDVAPTVAELAGLEPVGRGHSLADAVRGRTPVPPLDVHFVDSNYVDQTLRARDKTSMFKFVEQGETLFLYDLDADPGETTNLMEDPDFVARSEERIARARERLRLLRASADAYAEAHREGQSSAVGVDEEAAAKLRDLGYTDAGGDE